MNTKKHAKSKRKTFAQAILSGMALSGQLFSPVTIKTHRSPDDVQAIRSDWMAVGKDFNDTIQKGRKATRQAF